MLADLQTIHVVLGIIALAVGVLGTIFGWFGKFVSWIAKFFRPKSSSAIIEIPKKTLIVLVSSPQSLWWHMGAKGVTPVMQIVGNLRVTNISKYDILPTGVKMRKPKALGHILTRDVNTEFFGEYFIPEGTVSEVTFTVWVQPPVRTKGELFKADIAIVDQFGNEHWLKGVDFRYS